MLKIYFGTHLPESLTSQFDRLLQCTDIVAMEFACSNGEQEEERNWNAVSRGEDLPPTTALSELEEFTNGFLGRLVLTNKLVVFEKSPVKKNEQEQACSLYDESPRQWALREIDKAVQLLRKCETDSSSRILRRDIAYAQQLQSLTTEYTGKEMLCVRGTMHYETLPIILGEKGINFRSYLFKEPYTYSLAEEVTRAIVHGQTVSDEILMRRHIEEDYTFQVGSHNYETRVRIREKVLSMNKTDIDRYIATPATSSTAEVT